jgi:6-hydroxytryprostatin B O-methyltransferase
LEQFAAQLHADAKEIVDFCKKNDHPNRSLEHVEPQNLLPVNAPGHVREVRQRLVEAAMKVIQLANDPDDFLQNFQVQVRAFIPQN